MAWTGYLAFDETEIINVARTEHYAARLPWFKPTYQPEYVEAMLGESYGTPLTDGAPWVDPDNADSLRFYGAYPLEWTGFEDSTRSAEVTEFTTDGGNPGRIRHTTRSVVVSAVLIGEDEYALEYGFKWLKRALMGRNCDPSTSDSCFGRRLTFFSGEPYYDPDSTAPPEPAPVPTCGPVVSGGTPEAPGSTLLNGGEPSTVLWDCLVNGGEPDTVFVPFTSIICPFVAFDAAPVTPVTNIQECLPPFVREFRNVVITQGPTVTTKRSIKGGANVWTVQFTAVAGIPFEFSQADRVLTNYLFPSSDPFEGAAPGVQSGGYSEYPESYCPTYNWGPFFDPNCPALTAPPGPPDIPLGCYVMPNEWKRYWATVNENYIPLWSDVVPYLTITATDVNDVSGMRVRFYPDDGSHVPGDCDFVGEFFISTIPAGMTLYIDGAMQAIYIDQGYGIQRADSLVYSSNGKPLQWPELSCGEGYILTVDLDPDDGANPNPPSITLDLIGKVSA